jgi:hypothetical protein
MENKRQKIEIADIFQAIQGRLLSTARLAPSTEKSV